MCNRDCVCDYVGVFVCLRVRVCACVCELMRAAERELSRMNVCGLVSV